MNSLGNVSWTLVFYLTRTSRLVWKPRDLHMARRQLLPDVLSEATECLLCTS